MFKMKKVLTILIAAIILVSGMQVSVDRHYCGGKLIDVKISVTGKLASCGMEQTGSSCPDHPTIDKKCCENQLSFFSLNNNYYPEYFKSIHQVSEKDILPMHMGNLFSGSTFNKDLVNWVLPPGNNLKSRLTQSDICVFRI